MGAGTFRQDVDTDKHTFVNEGKNLTYAVSHMCGWRTFMEDAHLAVSPLSDEKNHFLPSLMDMEVFFVSNSGAEVAIFSQKHFAEELQNNQHYQKQNYELTLRATFFRIDQLMKTEKGKLEIKQIQIQQNQNRNGCLPTESQAGCTANVWLITPSQIYVANAGDSRGVLSINKKCQETSKDHKPDDKLQLQRIIKAGGSVTMGRVNGNINLSRAFGDFQFKQSTHLSPEDIRKFKNENVDFAIIGCDGIWEQKSCQEMIKWVSERIDKKPIGTILQQLFDELIAKERTITAHGTDNMSAILIKFPKKANQKTNDQIGSLLQKYMVQKGKTSTNKVIKQRRNDEIIKLVSKYFL